MTDDTSTNPPGGKPNLTLIKGAQGATKPAVHFMASAQVTLACVSSSVLAMLVRASTASAMPPSHERRQQLVDALEQYEVASTQLAAAGESIRTALKIDRKGMQS